MPVRLQGLLLFKRDSYSGRFAALSRAFREGPQSGACSSSKQLCQTNVQGRRLRHFEAT